MISAATDAVRRERFYSLDVLRGLAALTVVFWHWQHFNLIPGQPAPQGPPPFYDAFSLFYGVGWIAVDLFFVLSGFIFFWLYSAPVFERRLSARDFFVLRASRLYPLHLVTLVGVAAGQAAMVRLAGGPFVYVDNDAYHFLLNLGFASSWGLERGFSFNAPVWSVSVEAALYVAFFVVCRLVKPRPAVTAALSAIGFFGISRLYMPLARGCGGFFLGGCVYFAFEAIVRRGYSRLAARVLPIVLAGAWVATTVYARRALAASPMPWRFDHLEDQWAAIGVLFPLTVLTLAVVESRRGTLGKRLAVIGDLSYASYLLHFPLQLVVALLVVANPVAPTFFHTTSFFLWFFALVIAMSFVSYHWLERPAQRWIRRRFLSTAAERPATVRVPS